MKMDIFEELPSNPFLPGHPTVSENFFGRKKDIDKIIRYLPRVLERGLPEHFFITGKRGMGKTSFIRHVSYIAEEKYNMFPVYINNEGTNTIDELIAKLLEKLFREFKKSKSGRDYINSFLNRFESVNIGSFGFKFKDQGEIVSDVKDNFTEFLSDLCDNLGDHDGIFIIIDDVNGLSRTSEFPNWYKSLFETLEFYGEYVPAVFSLVTYPDKFDQLCQHNPSFSRMFNLITMDRLNDGDVRDFFEETFASFNIQIENRKYLDDMVYYSWGMPLIMQQIGDAIFWNLNNNYISEESVYSGIENAATELKNKPLKNILNQIKNPRYNNILLKLAENEKFHFKKDELCLLLNDNELAILNDFISKMLEINIIECRDSEVEEYEFANIAYFVYFLISSTFKRLL